MKHLVIGASGLIGSNLSSLLKQSGESVIGTYNRFTQPGLLNLDICDHQAVKVFIEDHKPDTVYLPAALANVELVESEPYTAYRTNVDSLTHIISATNKVGAKLVYFSSDYIFDGLAGPYSEDDAANPISEYGKQKLCAEHLCLLRATDALIIRTTVVYGIESQKKNFVIRLIQSLKQNQQVKIPTDQVGSPTYIGDLCSKIFTLVQMGAVGVFNVTGGKVIDRYSFALEVAKQFDLNTSLLLPVKTEELGQIARRPLKAGLLVNKLENMTKSSVVPYVEGLIALKQELMQND